MKINSETKTNSKSQLGSKSKIKRYPKEAEDYKEPMKANPTDKQAETLDREMNLDSKESELRKKLLRNSNTGSNEES